MLKRIPHTYVIIFSLILLSAIATWFVPGGEYINNPASDSGSELIYQQIESKPQTWQIFSAFFSGFERQAGIIIFILMIGGAFWIVNDSKAIDTGIQSFIKKTQKLENIKFFKKLGVGNIIVTFTMLMFSVFGAVFGMSEETIAFIIILVPLAISLGYDSITGVGMVFFASALGFAGAVLNPFTIGIAQGLADLPLFSGIEYRLFCWLVINVLGIGFMLRYANKVKKNPKKSPVYEEDSYWRQHISENQNEQNNHTYKASWIVWAFLSIVFVVVSFIFPITNLKIGVGEGFSWYFIPLLTVLFVISGYITLKKSSPLFVLNLLGFTILFLILGVLGYQWYIKEIAALFFSMGILSGIAMSYKTDKIANLFIAGAQDIMSAALVVGLAGGIIIILEDGNIIHSILHSMASKMQDAGEIAAVGIMYVIQTIINIVIPSGSAKAALTMPIMAPFSDLIGLSRQATVMAFQFGDGFTNLITPTSGVLIGVLGIAKIPYAKWIKWIMPFMIILIIVGFLLLIPTVTMDLNGF